MKLEGLIPILATPFNTAGELDLPSLRRLIEFQMASGAAGIAVFGMASEAFALTAAERAVILAETRAATPATLPLVAGVNGTSTATTVEQALAARDGGADALMVLPPYLVKPSGGQLIDFYGTVAIRSGLHIMVQDAPNATGVTMPVSLLVELSKLDGVDSVKIEAHPTAPKVGEVVAATEGGWVVFGGQNALFVLEEHAGGALGTMPACEFTDLLAPVLADWKHRRRRQAHHAFTRLLPLVRFGLQPQIAWAVHKEVLVRRGIIDTATVRAPAAPLDAASRAALDDILDLELLCRWRP